MVSRERRQPDDVLVPEVEAVGAELGEGGVHVPGAEQYEGVEHQAEGADPVLHAVLVALVELPGPADDFPGERVVAFLEVGLHLDLAPVAGLVGQAQDVEGLRDPPTFLGVTAWREACEGNFMQLGAGVGNRIVCNTCGATRRLCRVADHD